MAKRLSEDESDEIFQNPYVMRQISQVEKDYQTELDLNTDMEMWQNPDFIRVTDKAVEDYYKAEKRARHDDFLQQPSTSASNFFAPFAPAQDLEKYKQCFKIVKVVSDKPVRRFRSEGKEVTVQINEITPEMLEVILDGSDLVNLIGNIFECIFKELFTNIPDSAFIGVTVQSENFSSDVYVPFCKKADWYIEKVLTQFRKLLQSGKEIPLNNNLIIKIVQVTPLNAGVAKLKSASKLFLGEWLKKKRGVVTIQNNDDLCVARAIVTSLAKYNADPDYAEIRQGRKIQEVRARQLHYDAGVPIGRCGLQEISAFEKYLQQYQFIVYSIENGSWHELIYAGESREKTIGLFYYYEHVALIQSFTAFHESSYYCFQCFKPRNNKQHSCINRCRACKVLNFCQKVDEWIICNICHRCFKNQDCLTAHNQKQPGELSTCDRIKKCLSCWKDITESQLHRCNEKKCPNCKEYVGLDHQCYILPYITQVEKTKPIFIFFDFESTQDRQVDMDKNGYPIYLHEPCLCVCLVACALCKDNEPNSTCDSCGPKLHNFDGEKACEKFCEFLFHNFRNRNTTCIAHYAQNYDSHFIVKYILSKAQKPNVILRGQKIVMMEYDGIRFIDSFSYISVPLAKLADAFDISEVAKGYFPHLFNTRENQTYVGIWPGVEFYNPDGMTVPNRKKFLEWYEMQRTKTFDLQKELLMYCESDVMLLARACLKFRDLFMESADGKVDPFQGGVFTLPAACNLVFRSKFLKKDEILQIPQTGLNPARKYSIIACKWLEWLGFQNNIEIHHALNRGEIKLLNHYVDGFHAESKTIYDFLGCAWHGCISCFKLRDTLIPYSNLTMREAFERTLHLTAMFERAGYTVIQKWECELNREIAKNLDLKRFIDQLDFQSPLQPIQAYYGGRCESVNLFAQSNDIEKLYYYDVCSMYPYICKSAKFPIGKPTIITQFEDLSTEKYFGLIQCKILPPGRLYHPVLPYRHNKKLYFPLCRSCTIVKAREQCEHSDEERALIGTWCSQEIEASLKRGYRILKLYEVWHFPETTQYNPSSREGGLFAGYVDLFLKLKQEASGFPTDCTDHDAYIAEYKRHEGIQLDKNKIKKNTGIRTLAKLALNSLYGKFGEQVCKPKVKFCSEPDEFFKILLDNSVSVISVHFEGSVARVQWVQSEELCVPGKTTNVVIASMVTCMARLKLLSYFEPLGRKICYCDTDSLICMVTPTEKAKIPLGNYLGDLTDELECYGAGSFIKTFCTAGPKNYAYEVWSTDKQCLITIVKIKGFPLTYRTSQILHLELMKKLVFHQDDEKVKTCNPHKISRKHNYLYTRREEKLYRMVLDKRSIVQNSFQTVPFGY